jgi:histidinol-phosphatase
VSDLSTELEVARDLALLGGRIALGHFRKDPETKVKKDGSLVSEADWAVEAQIRLRIARTFPDHNILGEEEGLTSAGGGEPRTGAPTWIVDPIDGTNNYLDGIQVWATLVALEIDGTNVIGVCHAPALGETYEAALGSGARLNGDPIEVDRVGSLGDALVVTGGVGHFLEEGLGGFHNALVTKAARDRGYGDFWGHMLVARGSAHVMAEPQLSTWDFAALEPIVTEAGGRITTLTGGPLEDGKSCLSTCGSIHDEVVALTR